MNNWCPYVSPLSRDAIWPAHDRPVSETGNPILILQGMCQLDNRLKHLILIHRQGMQGLSMLGGHALLYVLHVKISE
jgi:hypothetical protein